MFEAVGMDLMNDYFSKIESKSKVTPVIAKTIDNKYFNKYINKIDFIQKYIFPGGFLP